MTTEVTQNVAEWNGFALWAPCSLSLILWTITIRFILKVPIRRHKFFLKQKKTNVCDFFIVISWMANPNQLSLCPFKLGTEDHVAQRQVLSGPEKRRGPLPTPVPFTCLCLLPSPIGI